MDWRLSGGQALALYAPSQAMLAEVPALMAQAPARATLAYDGGDEEDDSSSPWPWVPDRDGIVTIGVRGLLLPRGLWYCGFATSYDAIDLILSQAEARGDVKGVVLDVDSPGGYVAGCFSCATRIRGSPLPVAAVAAPSAYSAAYALACAAGRIFGGTDSGLGSIGVIQSHFDISGMFEKMGIKPTVFRDGERKARPQQIEPLTDADRAEVSAEIAAAGVSFRALVAAHRELDPGKIQALQARCLTGADALAAGLCDEIGGMAQARAWVIAKANEGKSGMSVPAGALPQAGAAAGGTPADAQSLSDRLAAQIAAAREEGRKEGVAAERSRAAGIIALCDVAQMPKRATGLISDGSALEAAAVSLQRTRADASDAAGGPVDSGQPGTGQGLAGAPPKMNIDDFVAQKYGGANNG